MNVPNSLTLLRIFFVPLLVAVLLGHWPNGVLLGFPVHFEEWGVLILASAAVTDWLDGMIARRRSEVTTLGILLDPIADKLLITAAFISLVDMGLVPAWMVVIIIGREFTVLGLRNIASAEGLTIEASGLGKAKMALQVVAACTVMITRRFPALHTLAYTLLWLVVIFAVLSAVQYFLRFWSQVDDRVKKRRQRLSILERLKKTQDVPAPPGSLERHET
ncbi:MAG TPA: CDP-diacylglycerol--glycerol-3-phosphate 3-phosphatidyltransferase [Candidatus Binatia bacterium]|nr:CDP-diacylglycerol--glycerol-3-phosphate 3-phosphatidyltransferase [Candidatus Binatia bacterium]